MPWYFLVPLVMAALVGLLLLIGSRLERRHAATSTVDLRAAPAQVWATISDWRRFPEWRKDLKSVAEFRSADGASGWVESSDWGRLPLVIERAEPDRLMVLRIADDDLPFGGTWTHRLEALPGGGTRLASTEDGFVGPPLFRLMAKVFGHHRTLNAFQVALAGRLGEAATPANR